jgi:glycosyltransferase involved in cell wall biosynthesis
MAKMPRIGYAPYSESFSHPGDCRRFAGYAVFRELPFEVAHLDEKYDLVVLSERADISKWCNYPHGMIVYDFIDSYLSIPYNDTKGCLRGTAKFITGQHARLEFSYWETIRNMCRRSDAVVCTTQTQRSLILPYCETVHIILDLHNSVVNEVKREYTAASPFKLVWEGLPSNISQLGIIKDVLYYLDERYPVELHLVTDLVGYRFLGNFWKMSSTKVAQQIFDRIKIHEWKKETCARIISQCDVAVIPIDLEDPFVAGKPENKLLFLWRMGMPVVTSATSAYVNAMDGAGLALACKDSSEWISMLEAIFLSEDARRVAGEKGKEYVNRNHNHNQLIEKWDRVFQSIGYDFTTDN